MPKPIVITHITYFGQRATVVCDGNCRKAWGINNRPKEEFDENDPDDYRWLTDDEIQGEAPEDPGTYEGGEAKPRPPYPPAKHNKWCVRECERRAFVELGDTNEESVRDFSKPIYNMPWKHEQKDEIDGRSAS